MCLEEELEQKMISMADNQDISDRIKTIDGDGYEVMDDVGTDDEEKAIGEESKDAAENSPEGAISKETKAVGERKSYCFPTKAHPVPCDVCNALFTREDALRAHKATHTGEKPFTCPVCKKSYMKARYLREHKRTHSGKRPFACVECPKTFARSNHLAEHRREHVGDLRYKCELCGKCYLKSRYLRHHKKSCQKRKAVIAEAEGKDEDEVKAIIDEESLTTDVLAE